MTGITADLRSVGLGLHSRVVRYAQQIRRTKPGPALIRLTASVAALGALALAVPPPMLSSQRALFGLPFALVVGLFPRTRYVTIVAVFTIGMWLIRTIAFDDGSPAIWRVALLTAALYVTHAGAALAAILPYDCVVAPRMLVRWAGQTAGIIGASLVLGLTGMVVVGQLPATRTVVAPILGSVVAAGLAGLLAWHLRRR